MFFKNYALVLLVATICSCSDEKPLLEGTVVNITEGIELTLPEGIQFRALQGHDSTVGEIVDTNDDSFYIYIDIGGLAGSYVDQDDDNVQSGRSINEKYIYQKKERAFLNRTGCCFFFTFPDVGPANFVTPDDDNIDRVIDIIESLNSKL